MVRGLSATAVVFVPREPCLGLHYCGTWSHGYVIDCSCGGVYYSVAIVPTSVEIGVLLIAYIEHLHRFNSSLTSRVVLRFESNSRSDARILSAQTMK